MKRTLVHLALFLTALGFFLTMWSLRGPHDRVRGDEGTYLAMTESLVRDADLWFEGSDQGRLEAAPRPGRKAVILQRVDQRVAYSKPILYPLLAAPFFALFGASGLVVVNALALAAALVVLALYLRRLWPRSEVLPLVVAFIALGLLLPYVPWRTSDTLQAALAIAGLALCLWDVRPPAEPGLEPAAVAGGPGRARNRILIGGALLGVLVSLRLTNGLIAGIPVVALLVIGRRRQATLAAAGLAAAIALGAGATWGLAGAPSAYLSVRATFTPETGYPAGTGLVGMQSPFDYDRATTYDETKKIVEAPLASLYGAIYYFVGRHTGVLLYFPLAIFLVGSALRRADRTAWVVILAVAGLAAFYLLFIPFNYFGGVTCVGNRYFLVSYAALPFALTRPPGRRALAAAWVLGLLLAASALASVLATAERDRTTQNHAFAGLFRRAPYESTAAGVDGVRDVYWKLDFGRFVDPFAAVGSWKFKLSSEDPAAEIELANLEPEAPLRLHVLSSAPRLELVYSDWGQRLRIPLEAPMGERGLVEIQPSRPLRYHPLWFRNVWDHGLPYHVRDFRLAIRTPDLRPVVAEIRYLGDAAWPRRVFARRVVDLALPVRARPGSTSEIPVVVENASAEEWPEDGPFPVLLSYRLAAEDGSATSEGTRARVGKIAAGASASGRIEVDWPTSSGRYRLTVDLLIEGVSWFADRVGEPLAEAVVEVGENLDPGA